MELVEGQQVTLHMNGRTMTARVAYRKPWDTAETLTSTGPYWLEAEGLSALQDR